jgi:2-methylcitrate dehydratase PrpD
MAKAFQAGHAARAGVLAAKLAAEGMTADERVFDGPHGYLETYSASGIPLQQALVDLGARWEVLDPGLNVKRWACCYCCHRAIGGLIGMMHAHAIAPSDVLSITVGFPPGSDEPLIYDNPRTGLEGKFSIEYPLAALLLDGGLTLESFTDEMLQRPAVRDLMKRIRRRRIPDEKTYSGTVGYTDVEIQTTHRQWTERITNAPGSKQWPLSRDDRRDKFLDCAARVLPPDDAQQLLNAAERCEQLADISSLVELTIPSKERKSPVI